MIKVPLNPTGQYIGLCGRLDWSKSGMFAQFQESTWMNNKAHYKQRVEQELMAMCDRIAMNKLYKRILYLWIAVLLCIVVDAIILATATANSKFSLVGSIILLVLVIVSLVLQIVTVYQIEKGIKRGLEIASNQLQSQRMNIYLLLKSDSCWTKMYGRLQFRFNFIEVYEISNQ